MRKKTIPVTFLFALFVICAASCDKNDGCYDKALYQLNKDNICTMDCPGVTGCDGKTYCNECVANSQGISVE